MAVDPDSRWIVGVFFCLSLLVPLLILPQAVAADVNLPLVLASYVRPTPVGALYYCYRVIDGDTIAVQTTLGRHYRVRYIGMDTPETPDECYAREATVRNEDLVLGEYVRLVRDVSEMDQYDRLLRYVYADDVFVNAELVSGGYALVDTHPPDDAYADQFYQLQVEAKAEGRGLWTACLGPTPTPAPPLTPTPRPTVPPGSGGVRIAHIYYDGQKGLGEPDEYCEIANEGDVPVNLIGWRLNADDPGQDFFFPAFELGPDERCRVYTNEVHPEWGGFTFGRGAAVWNNEGECGHLFDNRGREVSTYCYEP